MVTAKGGGRRPEEARRRLPRCAGGGAAGGGVYTTGRKMSPDAAHMTSIGKLYLAARSQ